jgi:PilZ domain-containing protein
VPEQRAVRRFGVTTGATIESGSGAIACVLRDVSVAGASLDVTGRGKLPRHFTLMAGGSHLPCRIIWRRDRRIGIAFD